MDVVIVTHAPDAHLLRYFLASYELYYQSKNSLILFSRRADRYLWDDIRLPRNTKIVYREDFPELGEDDFRNHIYLKLIAHRYVETETFWLIDSDFLMVAPCRDEELLTGGKPPWFFCPWNEALARWKAGSELFVGQEIPLTYRNFTWILSRPVAAELDSRLDLTRTLSIHGVSEFVVYGWFAHTYFPSSHHWVDEDRPSIRPPAVPVNQVPPDFCRLDSQSSYNQFRDARCVVFWSHWELAEQKMREFFEDSQQQHFGEVRVKLEPVTIFPSLTAPDVDGRRPPRLKGGFSDGWVGEKVWFGIEPQDRARQLCFRLLVPENPADPAWQLTGSYSLDAGATRTPFTLPPGWTDFRLPVPAGPQRHKVILFFGDGFRLVGNPDPRIFRARIESLRWLEEAVTIESLGS